MRGWVAGGGRLVIVGGTAGPSSLSAFPDVILPYRPTATTDVDPGVARRPARRAARRRAGDLPALSGELAGGRALASVGDRVVAAERAVRQRRRDDRRLRPDRRLDRRDRAGEGLWRRLLPPRSSGGPVIGDDSQIVSAASQLPSLALPPIGGLIALLGAYILLIGPINYLVLQAPRQARVGVGHDAGR